MPPTCGSPPRTAAKSSSVTPPRPSTARRTTLPASRCNHRRHALIHLVRLLYGRRAAVNLIDLVRFPPTPPKPRWIQRTHIDARLPAADARIEDAGAPVLDALDGNAAVTEMEPLTPEDSRLHDPMPYAPVPPGKRGRPVAVPLIDKALTAPCAFLPQRRVRRRRGSTLLQRSPSSATSATPSAACVPWPEA